MDVAAAEGVCENRGLKYINLSFFSLQICCQISLYSLNIYRASIIEAIRILYFVFFNEGGYNNVCYEGAKARDN
jgi:hypothetical protein